MSEAEPMYRAYCCTYEHEGSRWCLEIRARDWADAEARVARLGSLRLEGELMASIPCGPATRPAATALARAVCAVRNLFRFRSWEGRGKKPAAG